VTTRFFGFFGSIRLVGFRTSALTFRLRLPLLHMLVIILLGSLRGFVGLLLLLCPTCSVYLMLELGSSILLSTPLIFQGGSSICDSVEAHLDTCRDFI